MKPKSFFFPITIKNNVGEKLMRVLMLIPYPFCDPFMKKYEL